MIILIDGYNLIFECGFNGPESSPHAIERSRKRLIEQIVRFMPQRERLQTTIVFDAQKLPTNESDIRSRKQDIDIFFSVGYPDADTLIEELIANHSYPKALLVVSSDHRIQTAATRRRAIAIDSGVWFDRLEKGLSLHDGSSKNMGRNRDRTDRMAEQPVLDADQKAAWMEVFADGLEDLDLGFDPAKSFTNAKPLSSKPKQTKPTKANGETDGKTDGKTDGNAAQRSENAGSLGESDPKLRLGEIAESDFEQAMDQLDPEIIELMNEIGEMTDDEESIDGTDEEKT